MLVKRSVWALAILVCLGAADRAHSGESESGGRGGADEAMAFSGIRGAAGSGRAEDTASGTYRYARYTPSAIYGDGRSSTRIEVWVSEKVAGVWISWNEDRAFNDSGRDGDRIANDNVWTMGAYSIGPLGSDDYSFPNHDASSVYVDVKQLDGTIDRTVLLPSYGLVKEKKYSLRKVSSTVYTTPWVAFFVDKKQELFQGGKFPTTRIDYDELLTRFYQVFPDVFDVLIVMPAGPIFDPDTLSEASPAYVRRTGNTVRNIGMDVFNDAGQYGSKKLNGLIYHSFGVGAILDHEMGHTWGVFVGDDLGFTKEGHYQAWTDTACQMSSFPRIHTTDNGDGTYKVEKFPTERKLDPGDPYSPLTLYLMGLAPLEDVPPVMTLLDHKYPDLSRVPKDKFSVITPEQITSAVGGERQPAYPNAKKVFRVGFIVLSDHAPSAAEADFFSGVMEYFCSKEPGVLYTMPFYTATGGAGSLSGKMPSPK